MNAVEVRQVGKRYRLGEELMAPTLRHAAGRVLKRLAGRRSSAAETVWSLRDVTFDVEEGEAVGIVGRNGAGKTTLLKVVSRITEPTTGWTRTRGRVGSLLDVGTGFHTELTGRENVFLYGAVLGISRRQIAARFDEIVEFAGVERFLDTPVKRYSAGMHLRLAFAVAAHLEPDILVVDEVLAVGDAEFQQKCIGRMSEAEREGRTVLFVSHDLEAIVRLCRRAIWLDGGRLVADGRASEVVDAYLGAAFSVGDDGSDGGPPAAPVGLTGVSIRGPSGEPVRVLRSGLPFTVEVTFSVRRPVPGLDLSVFLTRGTAVRVLDEAWSDSEASRHGDPGEYVARLQVPPVLNVGAYRVGVWMGTAYEDLLQVDTAAEVSLEGSVKHRPDRVLSLSLPFDVQRIAP